MRLTSSAASDGEISSPKRTSMPSKPAFLAWRNLSASGMPSGKITEQMLLTKLGDACAAAVAVRLPAAAAVINCLLFMESPPEFNAAGSRLARYRPAVYALVIFLLNIYVARVLLAAEFGDQMGSSHRRDIPLGWHSR